VATAAAPPPSFPRTAVTGIFILLCLHAVVAAWAFLLPLTLSVMLYFLFMPAVRGLRRLRVPEWLGAALVVAAALAVLGAGASALARPASDWMARAPQSLERLEGKVRRLTRPWAKVNETAQRIEQLATGGEAPRARSAGPASRPGMASALLGGAREFLDGLVVVSALVYFLLASGDMFLRKLVRVLPTFRDKLRAVEIARDVEKQVSSYMVSHTLLNLAFGTATALLVWALGMPNPALWGAMAGITNYVPVLGALFTNVALGLAALLTFDDPARALAVPLAFLALNLLESNFLYAAFVGRRMTLNAPVVFVAVTFWLWAWGVLGALLAVPILATVKTLCAHSERLQAVAEFLGEEAEKPAQA
jgi:predicted PurR-regulated permease PerM